MQVKDLVLGERLRNAGLTGITLGILALIACELPLILVLFGLSGLGAGAWAFELPPLVENVGFVAGRTRDGVSDGAYRAPHVEQESGQGMRLRV